MRHPVVYFKVKKLRTSEKRSPGACLVDRNHSGLLQVFPLKMVHDLSLSMIGLAGLSMLTIQLYNWSILHLWYYYYD